MSPSEAGADTEAPEPRFSLLGGGPFNGLLGRAGLLGPDQLPSVRCALLIALLAWLLPGACAIVQSIVEPAYDATAYFSDSSTLARYFIAVGTMLFTERRADARTLLMAREFLKGGLLQADSRRAFGARLRSADYWSTAPVVEATLLILAWLAAGRAMDLTIQLEAAGWEAVALTAGGHELSWAGLVARHVSTPLFLFLALRWLWRLGTWSKLLYHLSRLPLQLRPLHPDRCGGIGFLSLFPGVFRGFVFALSCVLASLVLKDIESGTVHVTMDIIRGVIAAWALLVALLFLAPLLCFYEPLFELREEALRVYGNRSRQWIDDFDARWQTSEQHRDTGAPATGAEAPKIGDIADAFAIVHELRAIPLDRTTVFHLYFAALLPLVLVGLSRIPIRELLARIAGVLI